MGYRERYINPGEGGIRGLGTFLGGGRGWDVGFGVLDFGVRGEGGEGVGRGERVGFNICENLDK